MKNPLLIAMILLAAGCSASGVSPAVASPASPPPPSASAAPSVVQSVAPAATPGAQPPNALLSVAGNPPIAGALGTYAWLGTGSDAPWLRGTPVTLPPGAGATVSFDPPVAFATWIVTRTRPGATNPTSQREIASGSGPIAFTVPAEAGTILLRVEFANAGDANYFWALSPG
jgi:hypothetical protein